MCMLSYRHWYKTHVKTTAFKQYNHTKHMGAPYNHYSAGVSKNLSGVYFH